MITKKKVVLRTCVCSKEVCEKKDLFRIVRTPEGNVIVDPKGKANGRGAYLCNNTECLEKAIKTKKLERTFETQIENEIYESLRGEMLGK